LAIAAKTHASVIVHDLPIKPILPQTAAWLNRPERALTNDR